MTLEAPSGYEPFAYREYKSPVVGVAIALTIVFSIVGLYSTLSIDGFTTLPEGLDIYTVNAVSAAIILGSTFIGLFASSRGGDKEFLMNDALESEYVNKHKSFIAGDFTSWLESELGREITASDARHMFVYRELHTNHEDLSHSRITLEGGVDGKPFSLTDTLVFTG